MEIHADYTRLVVHLENRQHIALVDLTRSLFALANSFERYVGSHGDSRESREASLYVKEIRAGSIEVELIDMAAISALPLLENFNTVVDFAKHLTSIMTYALTGEGNKPEVSAQDIRDVNHFINPIAQDMGSNMTLQCLIMLMFILISL